MDVKTQAIPRSAFPPARNVGERSENVGNRSRKSSPLKCFNRPFAVDAQRERERQRPALIFGWHWPRASALKPSDFDTNGSTYRRKSLDRKRPSRGPIPAKSCGGSRASASPRRRRNDPSSYAQIGILERRSLAETFGTPPLCIE